MSELSPQCTGYCCKSRFAQVSKNSAGRRRVFGVKTVGTDPLASNSPHESKVFTGSLWSRRGRSFRGMSDEPWLVRRLLASSILRALAVLASMPRTNMTFLVTERGAPFSSGGFNNWFRDQCDLAGLPKRCSFHGLRKSCATRLADKGCSTHEIAAITGHRSLGLIAHYTRSADQQKLARSAVRRAEGEQKISNPGPRLDRTGSK
jgi:hypothetical protein